MSQSIRDVQGVGVADIDYVLDSILSKYVLKLYYGYIVEIAIEY